MKYWLAPSPATARAPAARQAVERELGEVGRLEEGAAQRIEPRRRAADARDLRVQRHDRRQAAARSHAQAARLGRRRELRSRRGLRGLRQGRRAQGDDGRHQQARDAQRSGHRLGAHLLDSADNRNQPSAGRPKQEAPRMRGFLPVAPGRRS